MFCLAELKDRIRIPPSQFGYDRREALKQQLNLKYANKVINKVGLCILLFEINKVGESHVIPGDGATCTTVHFSFIVFRPLLNEIIDGRVRNCTPEGVYVTLGFFDDIFVPSENLQHPSRFDEKEQLWAWQYTNEETEETHDLFMDKDERIRFRVMDETFTYTTPFEPGQQETVSEVSPYSLTASISDPGLGLLSWWS